jgi:hypothetical protein
MYVTELEEELAAKDDEIERLNCDLKRATTTSATLRRLIQTMQPGSEVSMLAPARAERRLGVGLSGGQSQGECSSRSAGPMSRGRRWQPSSLVPVHEIGSTANTGQYACNLHGAGADASNSADCEVPRAP